ncbi:MAG TPA: dihydropteroate synthase [Clostridia bacterium]|nr:dihydropteroate synthase [Clostridia bacterium]
MKERMKAELNCFNARGFSFPLGARTYLMGILNVTPDSFSDGGVYLQPEQALARALEMQTQGADILDIGAQSTRPGAQPVSAQEEIERLAPVLDALKGKVCVPISVDTFFPEVATFALNKGASIINDVSGKVNPKMADIIKSTGAGWVIMHNGGGAEATHVHYEGGVLKAVRKFFEDALVQIEHLGLDKEQICLDPGIGFGKSQSENMALLRRLKELKTQGIALLTGASRKRVIATATGEEDAAKREAGTIAAHTAAIAGGTDIIRVHDVSRGLQGARMADALFRNSQEK